MPRGFLDLDVQFPRLEGMEDDAARFRAIEDHERLLLENLRYILNNIGPDNFNTVEMEGWLQARLPAQPAASEEPDDEGEGEQP